MSTKLSITLPQSPIFLTAEQREVLMQVLRARLDADVPECQGKPIMESKEALSHSDQIVRTTALTLVLFESCNVLSLMPDEAEPCLDFI